MNLFSSSNLLSFSVAIHETSTILGINILILLGCLLSSIHFLTVKFWQNFFPQDILKAISIIAGKTYGRFFRKKIFVKVLTEDLSSNVFCWNFLILSGQLLFRAPLGGHYWCNKTCKERSDYYLLTNKDVLTWHYLCKYLTGNLPYHQYFFPFLFWKI